MLVKQEKLGNIGKGMKNALENVIANAILSPIFFAEGLLSSYIINYNLVNKTDVNLEYLVAMGILGGVGLLASGVTSVVGLNNYITYKKQKQETQ